MTDTPAVTRKTPRDVALEKITSLTINAQTTPGNLFDNVVDVYVKKEIVERTECVVSAIALLDNYKKELRKIKPDNVTYNADKTIASETYSKSVIEQKFKLEEDISKLTALINDTFEKNDGYTKLKEFVGKNSGKQGNQDKGDTSK